MSAPGILTLALACLILGGTAGSVYQTWTEHYRNMHAMTGRYLSEKAWLDARTAEILAELDRDVTRVKSDLKKRAKGGAKHGK